MKDKKDIQNIQSRLKKCRSKDSQHEEKARQLLEQLTSVGIEATSGCLK